LPDRLRPSRRSATREAHEEASNGKGDHCRESDEDELAPSGQPRAFASYHDGRWPASRLTTRPGDPRSASVLEANVSRPPRARGGRNGARHARLSGGSTAD
jgi:hypothetical protein